MNEALIRPGRIDVRVLVDRANNSQIRGIFAKFFPDLGKEYQDRFLEKIPEYKFTIAELQSLFLEFREDYENLLDNLELRLVQIEKQKKIEQEFRDQEKEEKKDENDDKKEDKEKEDKEEKENSDENSKKEENEAENSKNEEISKDEESSLRNRKGGSSNSDVVEEENVNISKEIKND